MRRMISGIVLALALTASTTTLRGSTHTNMEYSVFCSTEGTWVTVISATVLTNCPNNAAHTFKITSVRVSSANPYQHFIAMSTNTTVGTSNSPVEHVYAGSNSVNIGGVKLSAVDGGLKIKKLIVDGGPQGNGKSQVSHGDLDIRDVNYGVVFHATNAQGATRGWLKTLDYDGFDINVQIESSPEIPFEQRLQDIEAESIKRSNARTNYTAEMNANPNSIPALRSAVRQLSTALGFTE